MTSSAPQPDLSLVQPTDRDQLDFRGFKPNQLEKRRQKPIQPIRLGLGQKLDQVAPAHWTVDPFCSLKPISCFN